MVAAATPRKTVKKAVAKRAATKPVDKGIINSLADKIVRVPIGDIKVHPRNPNTRADLDDIIASLEQTGLYKPLVVQESSGYICAGNHTYLAARKIGWTHMDVVVLDIDNATAYTILLGDNKMGQGAVLDDRLVADLLADIPEVNMKATGYSPEEVSGFLATIQAESDAILADMPDVEIPDIDSDEPLDPRQSMRDNASDEQKESKSTRGAAAGDLKDDKDIEELIDPDILATAELQATLEIKEETLFDGDKYNDWGIPHLEKSMLVEDIPDHIQTWGGHEATPDDGTSTYLYNYSLGGVKGLPYDRTLLAFFTHDSKFENWWEFPAYYTAKMLSAGVTQAIVPDFSFYYTQKRIHHMWGVWRAQWLGRFFQDAGMKVIPRLQFDYTDPNTLEIALLGIPRGAPVIATSQQNIDKEGEHGPMVTAMLKEALAELKPKKLLYYSGPPGVRAMEAVKWRGKVVYVENYAAVRRGTVFDKKEGSANKQVKDRQKALAQARKKAEADAAKTATKKPEVDDDEE